MRLYKHQRDALKEIQQFTGNRYTIHMFCGTGKTRVFMTHLISQAIQCSGDWLGVIVVPWLDLARQLKKDYAKELKKFSSTMCFCSDTDLATIGSEGEELATTDLDLLTTFIKAKKSKLLLVTYQSLVKAAELLINQGIQANHVIFDEAHHTAPLNTTSSVRKLVYEQPEFENICEKIGFWSATLTPEMTEEKCGPVLFRFNYSQAVTENIVLPFELQVGLGTQHSAYDARQTLKQYFEWLARLCLTNADREFFNILEYKGRVNSQEGEDGDAVGEVKAFAIKENEKLFAQIFIEICETEYPQHKGRYNDFRIIGYHGEQPTVERAQLRNEFNLPVPGRICILSSCQTLKEGVDMPEANMVVLAKGSGSVVALVQIIGRVVRKSKQCDTSDKPIIALPLYISPEHLDELDDEEQRSERLGAMMRNGKEFSTTMAIIAWLQTKDNDPELLEHVLRYPHKYSPSEREKSLTGQGMEIQPTLHLTLADAVGAPVDAKTPEEVAKATGKDIELHTQSLEEPIETVRCGVEGAPLVRVLKIDGEDSERDSYQLVKTKKKKPAKPPPPRAFSFKISADAEIDLQWKLKEGYDLAKGFGAAAVESQLDWNERGWGKMLEKLTNFVANHNRLPAQHAKDSEEKRLSGWVGRQRNDYKKGRMDAERVKRLDEKNWWSWDQHSDTWDTNLTELLDFVAKNNRLPLSTSKDPEEKTLRMWIGTQRKNYKNKKIAQERVEHLEKVTGWSWDPFSDTWDTSLADLMEYVTKNNRMPLLNAKDPEEKQICTWVNNQRSIQKRGEMDDARIQRLQKVPGWSWDPKVDTWNSNLTELFDFVAKNNRLPSQKAKDPQEKRLGQWTSNQREMFKNKKMDADRIRQLDEKDWWSWDPFSDTWDTYLVQLIDFIAKQQRIPSTTALDPKEKKLAQWTSNQREMFKNKKMNPERVERFEKVPGWSWDRLSDTWNTNLARLIDFVTKYKRLPVSNANDPEEKTLSKWISHQRDAKKRAKLKFNKIECLESIPNWSWDELTNNWEMKITGVAKFSREFGKLPSQKSKNPNEKKLGQWVSNQRRDYKNKKMDDDRVDRLEKVPHWSWDGRTCRRKSPSASASAPAPEPLRTNVTTNMVRLASSGSSNGSVRSRHQCELSKIHKQYKNTSAANLNKKFVKDPALFKKYHAIAKANDAEWDPSELPVAKTARRLMDEAEECKRTGKKRRVADLGCGMGDLAVRMAGVDEIQVDGYDHVATMDSVTACNIAKVDKQDGWYDKAVMNRVLGWGRDDDAVSYLTEAHRLLDRGGELIIHEGNRKWWDAEKQECRLIGMLKNAGFIVIEQIGVATSNEAPIYMEVRALKV